MIRYVFDSYAIIAFAEGEKGARKVADIIQSTLIADTKTEIYCSVINWGEVYYITCREGGQIRAEQYRRLIDKYPITLVEPTQSSILMAAKLKARYKMSYADAFAASLAQSLHATLVTGDMEFKPIEKAGELSVIWI